jgi:hypothetical protein
MVIAGCKCKGAQQMPDEVILFPPNHAQAEWAVYVRGWLTDNACEKGQRTEAGRKVSDYVVMRCDVTDLGRGR